MDIERIINNLNNNLGELDLNLSIDCVLLTIQNNRLKVLLTKLVAEKEWVLPGGFILKNESAESAAVRILKQRTGLDQIYLKQFKSFSDPDRFSFQSLINDLGLETIDNAQLPERVISIGFFALVNYELLTLTGGEFGEDSHWAEVKKLPKLLFDHQNIITEAVESLRKELYFKPIAYNLLPEKFTMPELQKLYEIILDKKLERSSFQKKMLKWDIYERLQERRTGVAHKQPFLYRFDKEKYKKALDRGIRFGI